MVHMNFYNELTVGDHEHLSMCMLICSSCHALRMQLSIPTHSFIDTPQHHMMHKQCHAHCKHSMEHIYNVIIGIQQV